MLFWLLIKSNCFEYTVTLDISNCQWTNKFVRDIESSTYRVFVISRFDCMCVNSELLMRKSYSDQSTCRIVTIKLFICRAKSSIIWLAIFAFFWCFVWLWFNTIRTKNVAEACKVKYKLGTNAPGRNFLSPLLLLGLHYIEQISS